jgi:diguanylate cyclase (GGDEF)-like protein/PAS domain S-box-containing protein
MLRTRSRSLGFALFAAAAGAGLSYLPWAAPNRPTELAAVMLLAAVAGAFAARPSVADDWTVALPARVFDFSALLLLGGNAATATTVIGAIARAIDEGTFGAVKRTAAQHWFRAAVHVATMVAAMQAAAFVHKSFGGTVGALDWPMQGIPIAAAILAHCLVTGFSSDIVVPLVTTRRIDRSWAARLARGCSHLVLAAAVAVAMVEIVERRAWPIVPVAAIPLAVAYVSYRAFVKRIDAEHRRREVVESVEHGMLVVDRDGRITLWDDALERTLACPRRKALGRVVGDAVPALGKTTLPAVVQAVLKGGTAKTLQLPIEMRIFEVRVLPVAGGAALLWHDVTERARADQALKRSEERLSLAAEGAHDGLWEWDRRTQELYVSARWNVLVGLPAEAGTHPLDHWTARVHPDDLSSLNEMLQATAHGTVERLSHEHRIRHEDGSYRRVVCCGSTSRSGRRATRIAGSLTDITERAATQEQLRTAGVLDSLTGLSNRAQFVEVLRRRLEELKQRSARSRFAVLYLDLDRFKVVNDSLGHLVGDELLKAVSRRLESCLREGDALARLGGDEFAILLDGLNGEEQANAIAFRIQKSLGAAFSIGGREVFTSASIGIAFGRAQYNSPDEIMRDADRAMYHAKASGKARHELFDADMHARTQDRIGLESDLRHAVDAKAFELHYQPIVLLSTGMCVGFESLIRWTRNGEAVSPATFIPMAEELGLIEPVGTWCLEQACAAFAEWKKQFPNGSLDYITVNVSSRQLVQHNFLSLVERVVEESGLKPRDLRLEITETALMDSPTAAAKLLQQLRDFGVKIYLDDFGTGYSSLSHLHRLPVDALKIDRSFVKSLGLPDRPAIVESILALARTMNTSVVAEGIETELQANELERLGCTHVQGYLFARPMPQAAATRMLAANQPLIASKPRNVLGFEAKIAVSA